MLRPIIKYPFSTVIDETNRVHGVAHKVIHSEQSLIYNLDIDHTDLSIRNYIEKNFAPQQIDGLDANQLKGDNVFDLISPLSSRFVTDRAMRLQFANEMQKYLDEKKKSFDEDKKSKELKEKYDKFIESLSK